MKKYLFYGLGVLSLAVLIIVLWFVSVLSGLPDVSALKHYRPVAAAEVLDRDGSLLTNFYDRKYRVWTPLSGLSDNVIQAVVIAEDDTFFEHNGVNYKATWNALVLDVQKHRFARGGSTITQQMIKNVLLSKEKTLSRKVREYVLARKTEETLTKRQILEIYLNEVEWGENIYGIEAASRFYLDKHASELSAAEASLLAGMLPNPRYYNPFKRMDKARDRQERVLFNMHQAKIINDDEYAAALSAPLKLRPEGGGRLYRASGAAGNNRPCSQHALEQALLTVLDERDLHQSGRIVRTTLDKTLQDDLDRGGIAGAGKAADTADGLLAVRQDKLIRGFVCGRGREQEVRGALGARYAGYEVTAISPEAISRGEIIMTGDEKTQ
jgi:membrane peptidoglycan carboxypeptidase